MPKNWKRGSVECMDAATISETMKHFQAQGMYFGEEILVVPEAAVVDALNGKVITDPKAEYPCIVIPLEVKPNTDGGAYIRKVREDLRQLDAQRQAATS